MLPKRIPEGRFRGLHCKVYRSNGMPWNVNGERGGDFWEHGERVIDDPNIYWDADVGRFVEERPNGGIFLCRWSRHPWLPPEVEEDEPDFEPDFDDDDEGEEGEGW